MSNLWVTINIQTPLPAVINQSYMPFGFYKLGLGCWQYQNAALGDAGNYDGEIEWINTLRFVTQPKYANPSGFRYWFQPGIVALVTPNLILPTNVPDIIVNGTAYNMVSGENMPLLLSAVGG
jgi:hypothetical protein